MTEEERITRASKAHSLLNDSLLNEAFENIKAALLHKWETSPVRDTEGREYLFLTWKALQDARGYLEQAVNDGKVVVHSIQEKRLRKIIG